jgi:hypothetical protein
LVRFAGRPKDDFVAAGPRERFTRLSHEQYRESGTPHIWMREEPKYLSVMRPIAYRHGVSEGAYCSIGFADEQDAGGSHDASNRVLPADSTAVRGSGQK